MLYPLFLISMIFSFLYFVVNKEDKEEDIRNKMTLGDRMKYYEKKSTKVSKILPYQSYIIRLDGKNFSKKTSSLVKPFDDVFNEAMLMTSKDILKEFHGSTVFVQSDEISIIFGAVCTEEDYIENNNKSTHIFDGKVSKILSVFAGYTSTRFTINFANLLMESVKNEENKVHENYLKRLNGDGLLLNASYCFDSRLILIPTNRNFEAVNNILWRSVHDCYRNYVSGLAYHYFPKKQLNKLKTNERAKLLEEKNISVDIAPSHYKYGWYLKNQLTQIETEKGMATRTIVVAKSFKIYYSEEVEEMLYSKYWNNISESISFNEERIL